MKTYLITLLILGNIASSFSQSSTPTKEETIEWINQKLDKYSGYRVKWGGCWEMMEYYTYSSFLQSYQTTSCTDEADIVEKDEMEFSDICRIWKGTISTDNGDRPALYLYSCSNTSDKMGFVISLNWSLEEDLYNRMANAFNDLIKLNKPKETY